jgi:DNA-nicking Smr family endonuclease
VRSLSPDEAKLWERVTETIRPLSRDSKDRQVAERPRQTPVRQIQSPASFRALAAGQPSLGTTLDSTWDKRLRSGDIRPDRTLDLHGMSLDTAWRAIDRALEQAIAAGERILLLITGHHRPGAPPVERGKIRAAVHDWLAHSRHASGIAAVRGAHRRHGGGGSLYIILRRR